MIAVLILLGLALLTVAAGAFLYGAELAFKRATRKREPRILFVRSSNPPPERFF